MRKVLTGGNFSVFTPQKITLAEINSIAKKFNFYTF